MEDKCFDLHVLEWSESQKTWHIQTLGESLRSNNRRWPDCGDWVIIAIKEDRSMLDDIIAVLDEKRFGQYIPTDKEVKEFFM